MVLNLELFESMGFNSHPFSRYSAEEEKEYLDKIFSKPNYFNSLYGDIRDGNSRFIFGERGIGKTALIFNLMKKLESERYFVILIHQYDEIDLQNNSKDMLIEVLTNCVTKYSVILQKNKHLLNEFTKHDKEKLAFFIQHFFKTISVKEFEDIFNKAHKYKSKNFMKSIFNYFILTPTNTLISGVSEVISTSISKSLGLPPHSDVNFYKSYIPEFQKENPKAADILLGSINYKQLKRMLEEFITLVNKSGFNNAVIFFDKIDEYSKLEGNVSKISSFIENLTIDNELLQMDNTSFTFLVWNKVKEELNSSGTRFDKFKPLDINWSVNELKLILRKRIEYFSDGKLQLEDLFNDPNKIDEVLELANKSPRHLIVLMSRIYDEQSKENMSEKKFSDKSVLKGMETYIQYFDYHSLYPGKTHTKNYITKVIDRILRVGKLQFVGKDLQDEFKIHANTANNDIQAMKNYALIKDIDNSGQAGKRYEVIDPKIVYAINHGIKKLADN